MIKLSYGDNKQRLWCTVFLAITFTMLSAQVGAQSAEGKKKKDQSITLKTKGNLIASRDVGNDGAAVTTASAGFEAVYERGNASLMVLYEAEEFTWDKVGSLPFGNGKDDPWSTLHRMGLTLGYHGTIYNKWGYFVGGIRVFLSKTTWRMPGICSDTGGVTYSLGTEWFLSLGAGAKYHSVNTFFFPMFGISYVSKSIKGLAVELKFPISSASYKFNQWLGLRIFGHYDYGIYKLDKDSPAEPGGFMENRGYRTGVYVDFWPWSTVQLSAGCSYDFAGDYTLYHSDGSRIKRYDRDGGPGGSLQLKVRF